MSWHQKTAITLPSSGKERENFYKNYQNHISDYYLDENTVTVKFKVCKLQVVCKLSMLERKLYNVQYISVVS